MPDFSSHSYAENSLRGVSAFFSSMGDYFALGASVVAHPLQSIEEGKRLYHFHIALLNDFKRDDIAALIYDYRQQLMDYLHEAGQGERLQRTLRYHFQEKFSLADAGKLAPTERHLFESDADEPHYIRQMKLLLNKQYPSGHYQASLTLIKDYCEQSARDSLPFSDVEGAPDAELMALINAQYEASGLLSPVTKRYFEERPRSGMPYQDFTHEPRQISQIKKIVNALFLLETTFKKLQGLDLEQLLDKWRQLGRLPLEAVTLYNEVVDNAYQAGHLLTHLDVEVSYLLGDGYLQFEQWTKRLVNLTKPYQSDAASMYAEFQGYPMSKKVGRVAGQLVRHMDDGPSAGQYDYQFATKVAGLLPAYVTSLRQYVVALGQAEAGLLDDALSRARLEELQTKSNTLLDKVKAIQQGGMLLPFKWVTLLNSLYLLKELSMAIVTEMANFSGNSQVVVRAYLSRLKYESLPLVLATLDKLEEAMMLRPGILSEPCALVMHQFYASMIDYVSSAVEFEQEGSNLTALFDAKFTLQRLESSLLRLAECEPQQMKLEHIESDWQAFLTIAKHHPYTPFTRLSPAIKLTLKGHYRSIQRFIADISPSLDRQVVDGLNSDTIKDSGWTRLRDVTDYARSYCQTRYLGCVVAVENAMRSLLDKAQASELFHYNSTKRVIENAWWQSMVCDIGHSAPLAPYVATESLTRLDETRLLREQAKVAIRGVLSALQLELDGVAPFARYLTDDSVLPRYLRLEIVRLTAFAQLLPDLQQSLDSLTQHLTSQHNDEQTFVSLLASLAPLFAGVIAQSLTDNDWQQDYTKQLASITALLSARGGEGLSYQTLMAPVNTLSHQLKKIASRHSALADNIPRLQRELTTLALELSTAANAVLSYRATLQAQSALSSRVAQLISLIATTKNELAKPRRLDASNRPEATFRARINQIQREGADPQFAKEKTANDDSLADFSKLIDDVQTEVSRLNGLADSTQRDSAHFLELYQRASIKAEQAQLAIDALNQFSMIINYYRQHRSEQLRPADCVKLKQCYGLFRPYYFSLLNRSAHMAAEDEAIARRAVPTDLQMIATLNAPQNAAQLTALLVLADEIIPTGCDAMLAAITRDKTQCLSKAEGYLMSATKLIRATDTNNQLLPLITGERANKVLKTTLLSKTVKRFRLRLAELALPFASVIKSALTPASEGVPFPELEGTNGAMREPKQTLAIKQIFNAFFQLEQAVLCFEALDETSAKAMYVYQLIQLTNHLQTCHALAKKVISDPHYGHVKRLLTDFLQQTNQRFISTFSPHWDSSEQVAPVTTQPVAGKIWYPFNALFLMPAQITAFEANAPFAPNDYQPLQQQAKKAGQTVERLIFRSDSLLKLFFSIPSGLMLARRLRAQLHALTRCTNQVVMAHLESLRKDTLGAILVAADKFEDEVGLSAGLLTDELLSIVLDFYYGLVMEVKLSSVIKLRLLTDINFLTQRQSANTARLNVLESELQPIQRQSVLFNALDSKLRPFTADKTVYWFQLAEWNDELAALRASSEALLAALPAEKREQWRSLLAAVDKLPRAKLNDSGKICTKQGHLAVPGLPAGLVTAMSEAAATSVSILQSLELDIAVLNEKQNYLTQLVERFAARKNEVIKDFINERAEKLSAEQGAKHCSPRVEKAYLNKLLADTFISRNRLVDQQVASVALQLEQEEWLQDQTVLAVDEALNASLPTINNDFYLTHDATYKTLAAMLKVCDDYDIYFKRFAGRVGRLDSYLETASSLTQKVAAVCSIKATILAQLSTPQQALANVSNYLESTGLLALGQQTTCRFMDNPLGYLVNLFESLLHCLGFKPRRVQLCESMAATVRVSPRLFQPQQPTDDGRDAQVSPENLASPLL